MINFPGNKNIFLGISSRSDGNMKLSDSSAVSAAAQNRHDFFSKLGLESGAVVSAKLAHANRIAKVGLSDRGKIILDCDGLITDEPGVILTVTVADCLPVYFYDPKKKVAAIAHAGWRGLRAGIIENTVAAFMDNYHSDTDDIEAFIGPHIRKCHFEVKEDVAGDFAEYQDFIERTDKIYIDLAGIANDKLIKAGLKADNINSGKECTYCLPEKYFSSRRDKSAGTEAMVAYIGLK